VTRRLIISDDAAREWEDAYSYQAEIERREAERAAPHQMPVITMAVMLAWSTFLLCVVLFGSAGPELL